MIKLKMGLTSELVVIIVQLLSEAVITIDEAREMVLDEI